MGVMWEEIDDVDIKRFFRTHGNMILNPYISDITQSIKL